MSSIVLNKINMCLLSNSSLINSTPSFTASARTVDLYLHMDQPVVAQEAYSSPYFMLAMQCITRVYATMLVEHDAWLCQS